MSKEITQLLSFCIATLCDWLKNLAPLPRPIRSKTQTNRDLLARIFNSRAWHRRHVFASSSDWFIGLFTTAVIGQSNYFGFGFTTLKWKPLYNTRLAYDLHPTYCKDQRLSYLFFFLASVIGLFCILKISGKFIHLFAFYFRQSQSFLFAIRIGLPYLPIISRCLLFQIYERSCTLHWFVAVVLPLLQFLNLSHCWMFWFLLFTLQLKKIGKKVLSLMVYKDVMNSISDILTNWHSLTHSLTHSSLTHSLTQQDSIVASPP